MMYVCTYVFIYICIHVRTYVFMYVRILCIHIHMYSCTYIMYSTYVCMYIRMYSSTYVHTYLIYLKIFLGEHCVHMYMYVRMFVCNPNPNPVVNSPHMTFLTMHDILAFCIQPRVSPFLGNSK